ncbi:blue copper domain-containing protein, partial [Marine Group I thaumarchaeote SCGC AAA799-N04]
QTVQFYYEIAVAIIAVPAIMLLAIMIYMKYKGPKTLINQGGGKASPI